MSEHVIDELVGGLHPMRDEVSGCGSKNLDRKYPDVIYNRETTGNMKNNSENMRELIEMFNCHAQKYMSEYNAMSEKSKLKLKHKLSEKANKKLVNKPAKKNTKKSDSVGELVGLSNYNYDLNAELNSSSCTVESDSLVNRSRTNSLILPGSNTKRTHPRPKTCLGYSKPGSVMESADNLIRLCRRYSDVPPLSKSVKLCEKENSASRNKVIYYFYLVIARIKVRLYFYLVIARINTANKMFCNDFPIII